jgi:hypothetical protein
MYKYRHNTARPCLLAVLTAIGLAFAWPSRARAQSTSASDLMAADEEMVLKLRSGPQCRSSTLRKEKWWRFLIHWVRC